MPCTFSQCLMCDVAIFYIFYPKLRWIYFSPPFFHSTEAIWFNVVHLGFCFLCQWGCHYGSEAGFPEVKILVIYIFTQYILPKTSLIHLNQYLKLCEKGISFYFVPIFLTLFVKKAHLAPNHTTIFLLQMNNSCILTLNSFPLIWALVFVSVPCSFKGHSFVVKIKVW